MKINYPVLRKALGFAFLPTLLVIIVAMFATLSFSAVFTYLLSDSGGAIALRIILFVIETGLVCGLYFHYLEKEVEKKAIEDVSQGQTEDSDFSPIGRRKEVYELFGDSYTNYKSYSIKKITSNLIILKKL